VLARLRVILDQYHEFEDEDDEENLRREKGPHREVQYDPRFLDKRVTDTGALASIRISLIEQLGSISHAFAQHTGYPEESVLTHSEDNDLYTCDGDPWEEEKPEERVRYAEAQGCIASPIKAIGKCLKLWIASHSRMVHSVYVGGSSAWVKADSHSLSFDAILDDLLPPLAERDPSTWWIVSDPIGGDAWPYVLKVTILAEEQMTGSFPEL